MVQNLKTRHFPTETNRLVNKKPTSLLYVLPPSFTYNVGQMINALK